MESIIDIPISRIQCYGLDFAEDIIVSKRWQRYILQFGFLRVAVFDDCYCLHGCLDLRFSWIYVCEHIVIDPAR
jgi:hypothetical protein